jgi:hypothetical protein
MRRRLFLSSLIVVILLTNNYVYPGDTGKITGKVVDKITGKGLYRANVNILDLRLRKRTDAEGNFVFPNIPAGNHEMEVQRNSYLSHYSVTIRSEANQTTTINFELELDPVYIIVTGAIMDTETHAPISGASIILHGTDVGIESDSKGHFTLPVIDAKVYTIKVAADGYETEFFHDLVLSPGPHKNLSLTLSRLPVLETATFFVKHKPMPEIFHIVKPIVSKYGRIIHGGTESFTVTDDRNKLKEIKEIVHKFDIPQKQVWLEIRLILASSGKKQHQKMPKELETIAKQLKMLFRYQSYEILDDARVLAYEDKECFSLIGEGKYQIKINKLEFQDVNGGLIKLDRFSLSRENQNMLSTTVNIPNGDTVILGASNVDGGGKALITAVTARTLK